VALVIVMAQQTKRARGDGDAADEPTEGGAVVASASAAPATSSQQAMQSVDGLAVIMCFVYMTYYRSPAVLYLLANEKVAFQQAADQAPCRSHGNWDVSDDQRRLWVRFSFDGKNNNPRLHKFLRVPHTSSFELQDTTPQYQAFFLPRTTE
jgi:hypothetical protein